MISPLYAALVLSSPVFSLVYGLCDATTYLYSGKTVTTVLNRGPTIRVTVNTVVKEILVKGTITILDGCRVNIYLSLTLVPSQRLLVHGPR
jgi:hypothetical protein